MKPLLQLVAEGETLSEAQAGQAMDCMLRGEATPEQIAGLLLGLRARGETLDELTGFARVMRTYAVPVDTGGLNPVDLCGTGGDHSGSFNISTAASFVVAGAGVPVAKHGNKGVSSLSGSADVLDALGVRTGMGPDEAARLPPRDGHLLPARARVPPGAPHVGPVRKALGVRTAFNILGPLCNPAGVRRQLVGAFSDAVARQMAEILMRLGSEHVVVVYAHDGLDELSTTSPDDGLPDGLARLRRRPPRADRRARAVRPRPRLGGRAPGRDAGRERRDRARPCSRGDLGSAGRRRRPQRGLRAPRLGRVRRPRGVPRRRPRQHRLGRRPRARSTPSSPSPTTSPRRPTTR